jgi:hypothetical protein
VKAPGPVGPRANAGPETRKKKQMITLRKNSGEKAKARARDSGMKPQVEEETEVAKAVARDSGMKPQAEEETETVAAKAVAEVVAGVVGAPSEE